MDLDFKAHHEGRNKRKKERRGGKRERERGLVLTRAWEITNGPAVSIFPSRFLYSAAR